MSEQVAASSGYGIVFGAASPFGREIALSFGRAGLDVVLTTAGPDPEEALAVRGPARAVTALGVVARELMLDLAIGANVQVAVRQLARDLGPPSVCAVATDAPFPRPAERTGDADWARVIGVNLSAVFFAFRAVAREMARKEPADGRRGTLIVVSGGRKDGGAAYTAATAAVPNLAQALAEEWQEQGIAVYCIVPKLEGAEPRADQIAEAGRLAEELLSRRSLAESGRTYRLE